MTEETIDTPISRVWKFWGYSAYALWYAILIWAFTDAFIKTALMP